MKRFTTIISVLILSAFSAFSQKNVQVYNGKNLILQKSSQEIDYIQFVNQISTFNFTDETYYKASVYAIDSVLFSDEQIEQTDVDSGSIVYITYDGNEVTVINPLLSAGVIVSHEDDDAHVTIEYAGELKDIQYVVSGSTSNGSLTISSAKRYTLTLSGASITNPDSAAIHSVLGKNVTIQLENENTLSDGSSSEQKAALLSKGDIEISGWGSLTIEGNAKHGIFGSDNVLIESGIVTISAVTDGIHAEEIYITGGTVTVNDCGSDAIEAEGGESNGLFNMTDGSLIISSESDEGKGIKSDSCVHIVGGTIQMTLSGAGAKGISSDQSIIFDGGTATITLTGAPLLETAGSGYNPVYTTGLKCDGAITINAGNITITNSSAGGKGFSSDGIITTNGGTISITESGTGGTYTDSTGTSDTYTAKCISTDADIYLYAGNITCKATGAGGKCIKTESALVCGKSGASNSNLVVDLTTTGSSYTASSSSGSSSGRPTPPGGSGFSPGQESDGSSAKTMKATGTITINSGTISISTATDEAEGIESKTTVIINGGDVYCYCYDDCINSAGSIIFNGGRTYCWSTGNDAIDSNSNSSGAITINDGLVFACSAIGDPEEGIDCDQTSNIVIKGGYVFSGGGAQGGGDSMGMGGSSSSYSLSNATQGYAFVTSSISYNRTYYYTIADASNTNIVTFALPYSLSSKLSLISAPTMVSGSTYTIKYSSTEPTDYTSEFHGIYLGSTAQGTTSVTSFTAK